MGLLYRGTNGFLQNKQLVDWEHFTAKVLLRFPKIHLESLENHLANQMPSMTEYSSRFEAVSWGFTEIDVLSSCPIHVYTQERSKNDPVLPQKFDMQSKCKSKMDVHNMFDEMSTKVFTEEVEETSSAAILLGDLDNIQSTRVLDESVHSCCHKLVAESVDIYGAAMNLCVWGPGISSKLKVLTDNTLNTKLLILLGSTSTFGFIANANSVTQVWDPGQQRYELVVRKSKVDDTYSDVNRSNFSFRKKITEQASALKMTIQGKEAPKAICIARLQGCIRSMEDLTGLELHNFTTLAELKGLVGAQGKGSNYSEGKELGTLQDPQTWYPPTLNLSMREEGYTSFAFGNFDFECAQGGGPKRDSAYDTALFYGRKSYNDVLMQSGPQGNVHSDLTFQKDGKTLALENTWAFPRRVYFNGNRCVMPSPESYPFLTNSAGNRER
ncbi:COBRA-like protein 1 [Capsicum baccatum]|uniref:COBRA-like protein 1 n=1 Tax=Capsicum baccatum TaxID=33114 RepID=A0A2G2WQU9_CAPBA|nr:COBRA-like protein 1 [Capsicum baccatum]